MSTPDTKLDEILGNLLALGEMYSLDDLKETKADIELLIQEARIEELDSFTYAGASQWEILERIAELKATKENE